MLHIPVPLWLVVLLVLAAFATGVGFCYNNVRAIKAKATALGLKLAIVGALTLMVARSSSAQSTQHLTLVAGDTLVVVVPAAAVSTPPPTPTPTPAPPPPASSASNEPTGYVTQINTGAITSAPSCGAAQTAWTVNGATWSMFSNNVTDATGHNCANLQLASGHSGYRVVYPANVHGGSSPVMFGTGFPNGAGTGNLYVRFVARVESGWSLNGNVGTKFFEPRTPAANGGGNVGGTGQNDVIGSTKGASNADAWMQFLQQGSSTTDLPCFEYCSPYAPQGFYKDSSANLGAQHAGQWHRVEWLVQVNAPLGSNTGCLTLWIDSKLEWHECDVKWFIAGNTAAWNYLMSDATYGGGVNSPPGAGVAWDFDSLYVSTK